MTRIDIAADIQIVGKRWNEPGKAPWRERANTPEVLTRKGAKHGGSTLWAAIRACSRFPLNENSEARLREFAGEKPPTEANFKAWKELYQDQRSTVQTAAIATETSARDRKAADNRTYASADQSIIPHGSALA